MRKYASEGREAWSKADGAQEIETSAVGGERAMAKKERMSVGLSGQCKGDGNRSSSKNLAVYMLRRGSRFQVPSSNVRFQVPESQLRSVTRRFQSSKYLVPGSKFQVPSSRFQVPKCDLPAEGMFTMEEEKRSVKS